MTRQHRTLQLRLFITGAFVCLVGFLTAFFWITRPREGARADQCVKHMRQIGLEVHGYAQDHEGRYPPSLRELYLWSHYLTGDLFVCRRSLAKPVMSKNRVEVADNLFDKRHSSYTYCGDGLAQIDPGESDDIIVLLDPPEHHDGGIYATFADAHVEYFAAQAPLIMEQIRSGARPVRRPASPTTMPTTQR